MAPSIIPRSVSDAGAVAVEGSDAMPSRALAWSDEVALESVEAARSFPIFDPVGEPATLCLVHVVLNSLVGDAPADASARRHADPDGVPAAPLPSEPFAKKSSDAEDG